MPTPVPPLLSPYVSPAPEFSLALVTSASDTTSNWLLLRFIHAALIGPTISEKTPAGGNDLSGNIGRENQDGFNVVFVSVLRGFEQWREMGKKAGLDFSSLISSKRLMYINGLETPSTSSTPLLRNAHVVNFNLSNLNDLVNIVCHHAEQAEGGKNASKTILIMDGLDFLLASQPSITSLALSRTIMKLRQHVHNTVVTSYADYPLLHSSSSSATPLESEHRAFVTTMAHQSRIVVQLRSLGTGAAKDISGVLRVSAGGAHYEWEEENAGFEEGEWLYQVKGDGGVKIWGRGE